MTKRGWLVALAALAALATACGRQAASPKAEQAQLTVEEVTFGAQIAQARGHHLISIELLEAGDRTKAVSHASHPVEEVLPAIEGELKERDSAAAAALRTALQAVSDTAVKGADADELASSMDTAREALDRAERAVVGELQDSARYRGSVVASLLSTAAHEYEEAVKDGRIAELLEYQDGYAFIRVARLLFDEIADEVRKADAEDAEKAVAAFAALEQALPGPQPPATAAAAEDVERNALLIGHELEETVRALAVVEVDPEEAFAQIETRLGEILAAYGQGKRDEAAELAAKTYLESYEPIEADVIRLAPDVNSELEPILGAGIRAKIKERVPASELKALIEQARVLLGKARQAVMSES